VKFSRRVAIPTPVSLNIPSVAVILEENVAAPDGSIFNNSVAF
jgi:hypothetical protein